MCFISRYSDRFVAFHAEQQCPKQIWHRIPANTFTIATADNFDMLKSHSAIYHGDQQRSYHGTTVQLVQSSSKLVLSCERECVSEEIDEIGSILESEGKRTQTWGRAEKKIWMTMPV